MCSTYIVVDIANGCIKGIILIMASSNRHSCFVTAKDNWDKHSTMCFRILSYYVLQKINEMRMTQELKCLFLSPIFRHEILVTMMTATVKLPDRCIINLSFMIWTGKYILYKDEGITKPHFVSCTHPFQYFALRCYDHTA